MIWLGVAIAYALIIALGFSFGAWWASRDDDGGDGDLYIPEDWTPTGPRSMSDA